MSKKLTIPCMYLLSWASWAVSVGTGNTKLKNVNLKKIYVSRISLKPSQNKKGGKFFQLQRFLNPFLQLAAEKKDSKDSASSFFVSSYFDPTLAVNT